MKLVKTLLLFLGALLFILTIGLVVNLTSDLVFSKLGVFWSLIVVILLVITLFIIFRKKIHKMTG